MASRRVSISALLCEDDPPVTTSPNRPSQTQGSSWSPPKLPSSSPESLSSTRQRSTHYHREGVHLYAHQSAPLRRTPSPDPDLSHPPQYAWPPPSRRAYNPSQDMFPSPKYDPESSSQSRIIQQYQPPYMPPSPPRTSYPQSPFPTTRLSSDSPASTISLTRPPSIHSPNSPLLYTQRSAPSPGGYYHSSSFLNTSHHDSSFQPPVSPKLRHPRHNSHMEPAASSSVHHSTLSRISTTSSSSFPQALLNPVSPHQSPLGGLEALVQAATVERDRLEAKASLDRKADASRSAVQTSPELLFCSPLDGPSTHLQAPAPRTPVTPSLMSGSILRDSYSESSLRMGARPDAQTSKRRRQSDSLPSSERSWDPPIPLDSSSQFSGLMGPGMKPRRLSSEIRAEVRPTLPLPSRDTEEAATAGNRMSPPRDHVVRRSYMTEEPRTIQSHVQDYRETVPSATIVPDVSRHMLAAEEPRPSVRQELLSNVDLHRPPRKILRSDLVSRQGSPSPPPPPIPPLLTTSLAPPAPEAPTPLQVPCKQDEECSLRAHTPPHNDPPTPTATAPQRSTEIENAAVLERTMDSIIRGASTIREPSTPLVDSMPPDNLTATEQVNFVTDASGISLGPAESSKPLSPPLPSPKVHHTDVTMEAPDAEPHPAISGLGSLSCEDTFDQPSPGPETGHPPTTASPSPRASSPTALNFANVDSVSAQHPVEVQITAVSEIGTVMPIPERRGSVKAETSPTSPEELEVVISPTAATLAPAVEIISPPAPDVPSETRRASTLIEVSITNEVALEPAVTKDSKPSGDGEQKHADMDVDEELLNLIGDDSLSRSLHTSSTKQEPSSPQDKCPSSLLPVKQESAPSILAPPHLLPATTAIPTSQEGVSMLSQDTAVSARDSETSAVKLDERSALKKKTKQHAQPKGRAKPSGSTKTKLKAPSDGLSAVPSKSKKTFATATKKSAVTARSRSTSVMPVSTTPIPGSENRASGEVEPEDSEDGMEDRLYCICNTKYDDERVMIACDRCDEWYHTSCVNMPDLEVDLVDQFICPLCVEKNPHLDLRTTWKRRCLNGLKQRNPNSPEACHKPARGAFSKYCSDECGVQYMHMRISLWVEKGGNYDRLWETVKNAERREGVVVRARAVEEKSRLPTTTEDQAALAVVPPKVSKADRELARLRGRLETLVRKREELKAEMDVIVWREKVTELAIQHADSVDQCGWDQRLCFGDEEVAEFGASVLESYEEGQTDVDGVQEEAEWWCMGKKKCDRHSGWQKLRMADVEFDKETKDQALEKLTKLEREIRKRVEDILDPQAHLDKAKRLEPSSPRIPVLSRQTVNGQSKHKPNGDQHKKGKKRKE